MELKSIEEHLQEKHRHASFRVLQELDEEKLKVAKVIIGERIRRRLSQTALARRLGVTQQQVSKLEHGDFDNLGTLQKVLSVLGYHVRVSAVPFHRTAHPQSLMRN
jgi:DNA-binding transcriptional regulator YiaG